MKYNEGDTITIRRGKHRAKTATVLAVDATDLTYAVRTQDGALDVINAENVKDEQEAAYTVTQIRETITTQLDLADATVDALLEALAKA